jgi:hypothetical protein
VGATVAILVEEAGDVAAFKDYSEGRFRDVLELKGFTNNQGFLRACDFRGSQMSS